MNATDIWQGVGPVGIAGAGFLVFMLLGAGALLVTGTRRWHERHHVARGIRELMCDHCH